MKAVLIIALVLVAAVSCETGDVKKKVATCFAGREFINAARSIKSMGLQNFIKNKITLPGIMSSLNVAYTCLRTVYKPSPSNDDSILTKIGISTLLASNCEKDVGMFFLLLDNLVQDVQSDKPDWVQAVMMSIMEYVVGQQGYADCQQMYEYIRHLFPSRR